MSNNNLLTKQVADKLEKLLEDCKKKGYVSTKDSTLMYNLKNELKDTMRPYEENKQYSQEVLYHFGRGCLAFDLMEDFILETGM